MATRSDLIERFHYCDHDDTFAIEAIQDVEPILDANKRAINSHYGNPQRIGDMQHVARIPLVVIEKWKNELGVDVFNKGHWPKVRQLLNDPDHQFLRTIPGKI